MKNVKVKIQLDEGAMMPTRAHDTDVGYDVTAASFGKVTFINGISHPLDFMLTNGAVGEDPYRFITSVMIDTGVHITPPPGYYVELVPNSRLAKSPFVFGNSVGIIDPSYTGSIKVALTATRPCDYNDLIKLTPGNVVGQLIIREQISADFEQVTKLDETDRGDGGFGSTAK